MVVIKHIKIDNSDRKTVMNFIASAFENGFTEEDLSAVASFETPEVEDLFTFIDEYKIEKFVELLKEFKLLIECKDVTEDVLMGRIDSREFNFAFIGRFKYLLDSFLRDNLTKDMILDKINEKGIESITTIDKEILES